MKHQGGRRLLGVCESASRGEKEVKQRIIAKKQKMNNSGRDFIGSSQNASSLWPDDEKCLVFALSFQL